MKCDIKKFFASVDQGILLQILKEKIEDQDTIWLLNRVISSFNSGKENTGLPLGNLTSQLLVNIYMNKFDRWLKHRLKVRYYIRYADDFVVLSEEKQYLSELIPKIADFLEENLNLSLHPDKVYIKTLSSGVDFLGWVHFSNHRVLRTTTKRKMFRNLNSKVEEKLENSIASYLGMLKWGNGWKLEKAIKSLVRGGNML